MYPKHNKDIFYQSSCRDIRFKDYLLLGGGTDINPALYGEKSSPYTQVPNIRRDTANIEAIKQAEKDNVPVIGICRGFQLLDVYNGGKLFQHSDGHASNVSVEINNTTETHNCSSYHHQIVNEKYTTGDCLGFSYSSKIKIYRGDIVCPLYRIPQILYWEKQKHFAVQFHPEWGDETHKMNVWISDFLKTTFNLENIL